VTVSNEDLVKEINALKATNERILNEARGTKEKYQTLKATTEQEEKDKLTENEDWKTLVGKAEEKVATVTEQLKATKVKALKTELRNEVFKFAKDAFDVADIVNNLDSSMIEVNEEDMTFKGIEEAVTALRTKKSNLFDTGKKGTMVDGRPGMGKPKEKTLSDMTMDQKLDLLRTTMMEQAS